MILLYLRIIELVGLVSLEKFIKLFFILVAGNWEKRLYIISQF